MRELITRYIKTVLASAVCLAFLAGCVKYHMVYGFKRVERKFRWGRVGARLLTTPDVHFFWVNFKYPYELFIWFESDSVIQGTIQVMELKLIDAQTKTVLFEKVNIPEEQPFEKDKYQRTYSAYFSFKGLKFEYTDKILKIKFLMRQNHKIIEYNTELFLETDYKAQFSPPSA